MNKLDIKSNLGNLSSPKRNSTSNTFKKTKSFKELRELDKEQRNSRVRFDDKEDLYEAFDEAIISKSHNLSTIASEYEILSQENAKMKKIITRFRDDALSITGSLTYALEEAQRWGYVPARNLSDDVIELSTEAKHLIVTMCKKYATACREIESFNSEKTKKVNEEASNSRKISELTTQIEAFTDLMEKNEKNSTELLDNFLASQEDLKKAKVQVKNMMKDLSDLTSENHILQNHLTDIIRTYLPLLQKCSRLKEKKQNYALYHRTLENVYSEQAAALKKALLEKAEPEPSAKPKRLKSVILSVLACVILRKYVKPAERVTVLGISIQSLPRSLSLSKNLLLTSSINSVLDSVKKTYNIPKSCNKVINSYLLTCIKQKKSFFQEVQSILEILIDENLTGKITLKQVHEK